MARDISVELSVEGEREFNRQLKEAQNAVKVLGSELKASEASFKGGDDAQERYAQKARILGDQIEQERVIIERLTKAVKTAGDEFGQTDARTDKYRIALNRAKENVGKLEKQLAQTDREMEELGRDSVRVGRQLEDGIGEAADAAADDVKKMITALETDFKSIASSASITALTDIGSTVIDVGQSVAEFAESTRESRVEFGFLEQNARDADQAYRFVLDQVKEIYSITGNMEGATEGMSNLLATGFDTRSLEEVVDLLLGAAITFKGVEFNSLAESLQETIATGSATGAYAELLGRLGKDVEEFNEAMANTTTEVERQQIAYAYLDKTLKESKEKYEEDNPGITDAYKAAFDNEQAKNDLAEVLEPVGTAFTELATEITKTFTQALVDTNITEWIAGVINDVTLAVEIIRASGLTGYGGYLNKKKAMEEEERLEMAATIDPGAVQSLKEYDALLEDALKRQAEYGKAEATRNTWSDEIGKEMDYYTTAKTEQQAYVDEAADAVEELEALNERYNELADLHAKILERIEKTDNEEVKKALQAQGETIAEEMEKTSSLRDEAQKNVNRIATEAQKRDAEKEKKSAKEQGKEIGEARTEGEIEAATEGGGKAAEIFRSVLNKRLLEDYKNKKYDEEGLWIDELTRQINDAELAGDINRKDVLGNWRDALNLERGDEQRALEKAKKQGKNFIDVVIKGADEAITEGMPDVAKNGESIFASSWEGFYENFGALGGNAAIKIASGMLEKISIIDAAAQTLGDHALAQVQKQIARAERQPTYRTSTIGGSSGRGGTTAVGGITVALNIDRRQIGKAIIPEINAQMGGELNTIINA